MTAHPLALLLLRPVRADVAARIVELATSDLDPWRGDEERELRRLLDLVRRGVAWVRWGVEDGC